jgi:hypothetical protein
MADWTRKPLLKDEFTAPYNYGPARPRLITGSVKWLPRPDGVPLTEIEHPAAGHKSCRSAIARAAFPPTTARWSLAQGENELSWCSRVHFEIRVEAHMNWFYWDTGWSLVFGTLAFMTIVSHPDAVVIAYHPVDQAPIARRGPDLLIYLAYLLTSAITALRRHAPKI